MIKAFFNNVMSLEDVNRLIPRLQPIRIKTGYNKEILPEVLRKSYILM